MKFNRNDIDTIRFWMMDQLPGWQSVDDDKVIEYAIRFTAAKVRSGGMAYRGSAE